MVIRNREWVGARIDVTPHNTDPKATLELIEYLGIAGVSRKDLFAF